MITKAVPICRRIIISWAITKSIPFWIWKQVSRNFNMIRTSQWRECHWRTNTRVRGKKYLQKDRSVRFTVRNQSRKNSDLGRWALAIAVINLDIYHFLATSDLACRLQDGYRNMCFLVSLCQVTVRRASLEEGTNSLLPQQVKILG